MGSDKKPIPSTNRNWPACTANARVHDADIDRPQGKIAITCSQHPSSCCDILWRDIVRNIYPLSLGGHTQHNPLQNSDIAITQPKNSQEGNYRLIWQKAILRNKLKPVSTI